MLKCEGWRAKAEVLEDKLQHADHQVPPTGPHSRSPRHQHREVMTIYSTGLAVCGSWQLESLRSKLSEVGLIERELMSATVESQVRRLSTTSLVLISQSRP